LSQVDDVGRIRFYPPDLLRTIAVMNEAEAMTTTTLAV
jgi:hypothetical protein